MQGHLAIDQVPPGPIQHFQGLGHFKGCGIHCFLGQPFPVFPSSCFSVSPEEIRSKTGPNEANNAAICPHFGYVGAGEVPDIYLALQQVCQRIQSFPAAALWSFGRAIQMQSLFRFE